jgi:hypothetical protein
MVTPEQKAFCVLQFVKHESVDAVQQGIPTTIQTVIRHLPIELDAAISSFRQLGAFVKEKVLDARVCQKKA